MKSHLDKTENCDEVKKWSLLLLIPIFINWYRRWSVLESPSSNQDDEIKSDYEY